MKSSKRNKYIQIAIGSNIAQASGEGASAKVEIDKSQLRVLPASAPIPPSHFAGRKRELEDLTHFLLQKDRRTTFSAIVGMGGIGKTALVLKLAEMLKHDFPGGVFWGDFGDSQGNSFQIISYWELLCGEDLSKISDKKVRAQTLRGILQDRQIRDGNILIILDDVRLKWIEEAKNIKKCIPPNVPVLITTREIEVTQALRALPYSIDILSASESLDLIDKLSNKQIPHTDADQIAMMCGFIPLAIELGTAISMQEGTSWFLEKLKDSRRRLEAISLDHPISKEDSLKLSFEVSYQTLFERHPKDACVFRWLGVFSSYNLCPARITGVLSEANKNDESALFARLLIDSTGKIPTRKEAEKIANDLIKQNPSIEAKIFAESIKKSIAWPELDEFEKINDSLRRLEKWSLFRYHPASESKGVYYSIHPLLKDFAADLLGTSSEIQTARKAYITHFLKFAWTYNRTIPSPNPIKREYPNIMLAINYSYQDEKWDDFFRFATLFCLKYGHLADLTSIGEIRFILQRAIEVAIRVEDKEKIFLFSHTHANLLLSLGDFDASLAEHNRLLPIAKEMGRLGIIASTSLSLGILALEMENVEDAEKQITASLENYEQIGDKHGIACSLGELGLVLIEKNDFSNAKQKLEKSSQLFQEMNDKKGELMTLSQLAILYNKEENQTEAEKIYQKLIKEYSKDGDIMNIALNSTNLAGIYESQGKCEDALRLLETAYEIFKFNGSIYADKIYPELKKLKKQVSMESSG